MAPPAPPAVAQPSPRTSCMKKRYMFLVMLICWVVYLLLAGSPSVSLFSISSSASSTTSSRRRQQAQQQEQLLTSNADTGGVHITPLNWQYTHHQHGYSTWLFTDLFLKNDALVFISMVYVQHSMPHQEIRVSIKELGVEREPLTRWHIRDNYESSAIGLYEDPRLLKLTKGVEVSVHFQNETRTFAVVPRASSARSSQFAACALFHTDKHLMEMWSSYWWLLGVDTFYMYYNGVAEDIPALQARADKLKASFTFIHWPYDYWVSEGGRPHSGQPMAVNDCYYRNRDRHEYLVMYDLDELLVIPDHDNLTSFISSFKTPWSAVRFHSSWTRIELESLGATYDALTIDHIAALPLTRTDIDYKREKYIVNTSIETGITLLNVHGVYQVDTGVGEPQPGGQKQMLLAPTRAYHFHFVNVGRDRKRDHFVEHPTPDSRAMEMVRINLAKRGRPERNPPSDKASGSGSGAGGGTRGGGGGAGGGGGEKKL